jgi:hypothetical protein
MKLELLELIGRGVALLFALVIWPIAYFLITRRLLKEEVPFSPRFEFFVGIGTLGGWSLFLALAGSGPLIILPIAAFQLIVAIPASFFCLFRLARHPSLTNYHTAAKWILVCGILVPIGLLALGALFDPSHP